MATFYTEKEQQKILRELHIATTEDGYVEASEAARVLTWRALHEFGVEYVYDSTALRQHTKLGRFPEGTIRAINDCHKQYKASTVFSLPISPRRGKSRRVTA